MVPFYFFVAVTFSGAHIQDISDNILQEILSAVPEPTLLTCRSVCKAFYIAAREGFLYKMLGFTRFLVIRKKSVIEGEFILTQVAKKASLHDSSMKRAGAQGSGIVGYTMDFYVACAFRDNGLFMFLHPSKLRQGFRYGKQAFFFIVDPSSGKPIYEHKGDFSADEITEMIRKKEGRGWLVSSIAQACALAASIDKLTLRFRIEDK